MFDSVTEGVTFKESKRRFNNQKFIAAVQNSIKERVDGIGVSIMVEVQGKVAAVVEKYKDGLDNRIREESKILDAKVDEKKGTELLITEIKDYTEALNDIENVQADISKMIVEVVNGGNLER